MDGLMGPFTTIIYAIKRSVKTILVGCKISCVPEVLSFEEQCLLRLFTQRPHSPKHRISVTPSPIILPDSILSFHSTDHQESY